MSTVCRSLEGACNNVLRQFHPRVYTIISGSKRIQFRPQLRRSFATRSTPLSAQATQAAVPRSTSTTGNSSSKPSTTSTTSTSKSPISSSSSSSTSPPPTTQPSTKSNEPQEETTDTTLIDWSKSFHGLSAEPFSKEASETLQAPLDPEDIEIKPDGILYLPEIKYRRILNKAFGPGAWGLAPRSEEIVTEKSVTREYALVVHGRLISISRGEQDYFSKDNITTASEGCKSNAMMRCCKDLGIASELWDPRFIRKFKGEHTREVFVEHAVTKRKTKIWLKRGDPVMYPFKETRAQT